MDAVTRIPPLLDSPHMTLVEQLVQWARRRVDERVFRPGMRMPSIRKLATDKGISRFTVVEAYERLVAQGYLDARRGSGFYVREQRASAPVPSAQATAAHKIDVVWLMKNALRTTSPDHGPGLGYLPNRWLDGEMLSNALRAMSRQGVGQLLNYGTPQGFLPLRQHLQTKLAEVEIGAAPEQIVLLSGITQAIDLVARLYVRPGDAVLVGDPAWFHVFGLFAAQGARLVGFPYTAHGPDLDALENLVKTCRPRLLVINSVLHNPTSTSLTSAQAFRILQLAQAYDFIVLEDDIYSDLCPPGYPATRLAALDQLNRVIYCGSFSKTLAANLRVAFVACSPRLAQDLTDQKILATMTSPEVNERLVYKVLTEGHYRRHVERLRGRLDAVRDTTARALEHAGFRLFMEPDAGMFLWADAGRDAEALTGAGYEAGYLLAPGSLFSPRQAPSTWMRFNVANCGDPGLLAFLAKSLARGARHAGP